MDTAPHWQMDDVWVPRACAVAASASTIGFSDGPRAGLHAELVCPHAGLPPTPLPPARCPRSWVPSMKDITQMGIRDVHHESNQVGQGGDNLRHGADHGQGHVSSRSIRPGTALPVTVFVTHLSNGGLLLRGFSTRPSPYLSPSDARALRRELAAAFASRESARRGDQGETL
jgi:hypothetical protein